MSKLTDKIINGLQDIGYSGPFVDRSKLNAAAEIGPKSIEYTTLVSFLTNEIRTLVGVDEEVNPITSPENSVEFVMEISSFLKELNCPYTTLTQGLVSERLQIVSDRLLLVDYLITELMAARITQHKKPEKKIELKLQETSEGADMRQILQTLRFPKPPANITVKQLFDKLDTTIPIVIKKAGMDIIGNAIFNGHLSEKQWEALGNVQNDLNNEYKIRREMLLTRLDVTIQSFQWSDRTKGKDDLFEKIYHEKRKLLQVDSNVDLADLLAAKTDLAIIEKTSSSSVRKNTRSALNKVIIGQVPDRGGRSWEQAPPPPEMPSWQQRSTGPAGGGRGGGNQSNFSRGGGRGGYQGRGGGRDDFQQRNNRNDNQGGGGGYNNSNRMDFKQDSRGSSASGGGYSNFEPSTDYSERDNRGGSFRGGRGGGRYDNSGTGNNYRSFDDNRSFDNNYGGGRNESFGGGRGGYDRRDSGGSYGSPEYQQTKRPKTYDNFQANKTTYADQYVQEREHNQQYGRRDNFRGRSNYNRGGYR